MTHEHVLEVNGMVCKGSIETLQLILGSSIVGNGNGNGNGDTKGVKVTGLLELRSKRPDDYKSFLQCVVKQNKAGEKNKDVSSSMKDEWNVVLSPDRVWGIIQRYGNGYDWNKLDK